MLSQNFNKLLDDSLYLPENIHFLERGWLSANQILLPSDTYLDVVDSGFCTHVSQTMQLIQHHLNTTPTIHPRFLVNTHLHSDHCGGNAALVDQFQLKPLVPYAEFDAVQDWREDLLGFKDLGQPCPLFQAFGVYQPNTTITLGYYDWEIHQAPGHHNEAHVLFNPEHRLLISGDALWENGFGALFPDSENKVNYEGAFATIQLIHQLNPQCVLPGHGQLISNVGLAITQAEQRLNYLSKHPERNLCHVSNVLLKFKILEWQQASVEQVSEWFINTPMLKRVAKTLQVDPHYLFQDTCSSLERAGALRIKNAMMHNL